MDEMLDEYGMVIDISQIQPFQKLRDMLSFYTNEASRAIVDAAKRRGALRDLKHELKDVRANLMGSESNATRWRTIAAVDSNRKVNRIEREIDQCESMIDMLDALYKSYDAIAFTLSREITARTGDRDRWYGRGGSGR